MKKHFSILAIALMAAVVAFISCKKEPKPDPTPVIPEPVYEKTIVDVSFSISDDLRLFMNTGLTVNDFEGNEQVITLSDSTVRQYETNAKNASMKTVFTIDSKPDSEWPVIDTNRLYTFSVDGLGSIAALDDEGKIISDQRMELIGIIGSRFGIKVQGSELTRQHIVDIQRTFRRFGTTRTFTVTNGKKVTIE